MHKNSTGFYVVPTKTTITITYRGQTVSVPNQCCSQSLVEDVDICMAEMPWLSLQKAVEQCFQTLTERSS